MIRQAFFDLRFCTLLVTAFCLTGCDLHDEALQHQVREARAEADKLRDDLDKSRAEARDLRTRLAQAEEVAQASAESEPEPVAEPEPEVVDQSEPEPEIASLDAESVVERLEDNYRQQAESLHRQLTELFPDETIGGLELRAEDLSEQAAQPFRGTLVAEMGEGLQLEFPLHGDVTGHWQFPTARQIGRVYRAALAEAEARPTRETAGETAEPRIAAPAEQPTAPEPTPAPAQPDATPAPTPEPAATPAPVMPVQEDIIIRFD